MKKYIYLATSAAMIAAATSCDLDEVYKNQLDPEVVFTTTDGFNGVVNSCYENLYYLYGKEDGIPMMEAGDLWTNGSATGSAWKECINNYEWNTEVGPNKVVCEALYATIAYCNTAIDYQSECSNYGVAAGSAPDSSSEAALKAKVAEAYFLRGFSYYHIVEQWGSMQMTLSSIAKTGAMTGCYRNTEEEIYDQIISDLMNAYQYLPASQGEDRGRATKYAAAAMLCKAWIQRTRLERDLKENPDGKSKWYSTVTNSGAVEYTTQQCADSAFKYAKIVINESPYSLYASTDTESGSTQEWAGDNNKDNKEFIFVEAIDHVFGYNPEGWNRGRTRQYYMMSISNAAADFGIASEGLRYGRANTTRVRPTLWLLQDCFDPKPQKGDLANVVYTDDRTREATPDTRFADSFYYKYYIGSSSYPLAMDVLVRYGKDSAYFAASESRRNITGNVASGDKLKSSYPGMSYYADNTSAVAAETFELEDSPRALGCYTPNFAIDSAWAAKKWYLVAGLPSLDGTKQTGSFAYYQASGATSASSYYRSVFPSLKKLSPLKYVYTNQQCMNDFPIIRLTDIYLLAAECAVYSQNVDKSLALEYLNTVRRHAALSTDAAAMEVTSDALTIDYLAKERARELCGENWRWYDLKRMGLLTAEYLNGERKNVYGQSYQTKWYVRPVPQKLLDQMANPEEYGNNGY